MGFYASTCPRAPSILCEKAHQPDAFPSIAKQSRNEMSILVHRGSKRQPAFKPYDSRRTTHPLPGDLSGGALTHYRRQTAPTLSCRSLLGPRSMARGRWGSSRSRLTSCPRTERDEQQTSRGQMTVKKLLFFRAGRGVPHQHERARKTDTEISSGFAGVKRCCCRRDETVL